MKATGIALAVMCVMFAPGAHAFGARGHMTVGAVADRLLTGTKAGKEARNILGSTLRTASVWADCAKGVSEETFRYGVKGKFPECAVYENPQSIAAMAAYVKRNTTNCERPPHAESCHKQYHYTDVAIQRDAYKQGLVGTSGNDIVAAINAAIAVLKGEPAPAPFRIGSKREALRLLAHYVGDVHQPLHVGSVYLDRAGNVVDPDSGKFDSRTETRGGNDLFAGKRRLHAMWDDVPASIDPGAITPGMVKAARAVPVTAGDPAQWPVAWATDSLNVAKDAFGGLAYSAEDADDHHQVTLPSDYDERRSDIQRKQVIKAGARLAQILAAIWP